MKLLFLPLGTSERKKTTIKNPCVIKADGYKVDVADLFRELSLNGCVSVKVGDALITSRGGIATNLMSKLRGMNLRGSVACEVPPDGEGKNLIIFSLAS